MSNDDKIATLIPSCASKCREFIKRGNEYLDSLDAWKGYSILITQARRDIYLQAGLYSEGRMWNQLTKCWIETNPQKVVTHSLTSKHLDGDAFDIALVHDGKVAWPSPTVPENKAMWLGLAQIAMDVNLYPGAYWKHTEPDYCHFAGSME